MKAQDAIKLSIDTGSMLTNAYLGDLTDADLLHRPAPGGNHINWQFGHLINAEHRLVDDLYKGSMPPLPAGFADKYAMEKNALDGPQDFFPKADLVRVYQEQRTAALAALDKTSEADLDKPSGVDWAPTAGAVLSAAMAGHWLMHLGQWAVVRRQLGRKPLF